MAKNVEGRCCIMERYVDLLKDYLGDRRDFGRLVFNYVGTLYRAINNKRITWEQGMEKIENLKTKEEMQNEIVL